MYLRRSAIKKYFLASVIGAILYGEWAVYRLQALTWGHLGCSDDDDVTCSRVLFVADPQIQGVLADPFPFNYLYMWDSDRYLKSTFAMVMRHFKPHVIVFLGDLMDEGSVSTMERFHADVKRLAHIFQIGDDSNMVLMWLPGDNDIGGENEPVRHDKLDEFNKVFVSPDLVTYNGLAFLEVNGITHTIPNVSQAQLDQYGLRIVVSHYPTMEREMFSREVHKRLRPHVYFCAHVHESKYVRRTQQLRDREVRRRDLSQHELKLHFDNGSLLYEIYVPTCSYRMGTSSIGYGAAVVENNYQQLRYMVFWSPQRFPYLLVYLLITITLGYMCGYTLLKKLVDITFQKISKREIGERTAFLKNMT